MNLRLRPDRGECRGCFLRRDVYPVRRQGGGTYRRAGRSYRSSVCGECAMRYLSSAGGHAGETRDRFDVRSLDRVVASLGTTEAAEVFTAYRERRDRRRMRS